MLEALRKVELEGAKVTVLKKNGLIDIKMLIDNIKGKL